MAAIEVHVDEALDPTPRSLFRFEDGTLFAYARRQEWIRRRDGRPWAYVDGDRLISKRSGECLAMRVGNVYLDPVSRKPLYYEQR